MIANSNKKIKALLTKTIKTQLIRITYLSKKIKTQLTKTIKTQLSKTPHSIKKIKTIPIKKNKIILTTTILPHLTQLSTKRLL
jgi:hypothetical protein